MLKQTLIPIKLRRLTGKPWRGNVRWHYSGVDEYAHCTKAPTIIFLNSQTLLEEL